MPAYKNKDAGTWYVVAPFEETGKVTIDGCMAPGDEFRKVRRNETQGIFNITDGTIGLICLLDCFGAGIVSLSSIAGKN